MNRVLLSCALAALTGCSDFAAGRDAYREGRFAEAHAAFRDAEVAGGEGTSPVHAYNRALAALRAGELEDAAAAAQRATTDEESDVAALAAFLRGNIAFARCDVAERQAEAPGAEPFAFDVAILYAEKAGELWRAAAMTRDDWPEARRNAERARLRAAALRKRKSDAERRRTGDPDPRPRPQPRPEAKPRPPQPEPRPDTESKPQLQELRPEEVLALLDRLAQKEKEKLALRRSHRKKRMSEVERDW